MGKNVVRQDVVQVAFDVPQNPFKGITDELNSLKKTASDAVKGTENSVKGLQSVAKGVQNSFAGIKNAVKLDNILDGIDSDLEVFNTRLKIAKERFDSFKNTLKKITLHPIQTANEAMLSLQWRIASTTHNLKNLAKQKLTSVTSGIKKITQSLTGGEKGVKGFVTALKNIGKIGLEKTISGVKKIGTSLKDVAKTSLNKLSSGLQTVANKLTTIASKAGTAAYNALKKMAGVSFKALGAGLAAGAVAVGTVVTKAVKSFADYEQLVGGVDTLFKNSSSIVQANAAKAFETAGLSANQYMETVTSFSASLLQSLGGDTAKAAQYADQAIIDMADNANKMGTAMESIQNAYQGFAKQNYTMLDNLKLGYGGTKEEMQRLLADASKLSGMKFDISSYADVVQAIHVIQENMGITGTTALEASKTITGSLNAMKGAWQNMLTALVVGGDSFDSCVDNLVSTVTTFVGNVMPAVQSALGGVGRLIDELAPIIAKEIPSLVTSLLPPLLSAATTIVQGVVSALPSIVQSLISALPTVINGLNDALISLLDLLPNMIKMGMKLVSGLVKGVSKALPTLIPAIASSLTGMINAFLKQAPALINAGIKLVEGLADGIMNALPILIEEAPKIITNLVNGITKSLPKLITAGVELINQLINGLGQNLPALIDASLKMINALVQGIIENLPVLINGAISLINALIQGLIDNLPLITQAAQQLITGLCEGLIQNLPIIVNSAMQLILALVNGLINNNNIGLLLTAAIQLIIGIAQGLLNNLGIIIQAGIQVIFAVIEGLIQAIPTLLSIIPEVFGAFWDAVTSINWLDLGISIINGVWEGIKSVGKGLWEGVKGLFSDNGTSDLSSKGASAGNSYKSGLTNSINSISLASTGSKLTSELNVDLTSTGTTTAQTYVASMDTGLATSVTNATNTATNITKELGSIDLTSEGSDTVQGLINGMNSKKQAAILTARSIANAINAEYRKIQDIHSPSRVWEKFGSYQIQGDIKGMKKELPDLKSAVREAGETATPAYTPESSTVNNSRTSYNTFSPVFTLNMNGASASDSNKRKVKRWVQEAITETFDSMSRVNPQLIEV